MTEETHVRGEWPGPKGIANSILVSLVAGSRPAGVGLTYAIFDKAEYAKVPDLGPPVPPRCRSGSTPSTGTAESFLLVVAMVAPGRLRHGLGDGQLAHDLRLLPRRGQPRFEVLAPHQPPDTDTEPLDLLCRGLRLHPGTALSWSGVAYGAVISIAVIGLYIAYVIPTLLRRRAGDTLSGAPGTWAGGVLVIGWIGIAGW